MLLVASALAGHPGTPAAALRVLSEHARLTVQELSEGSDQTLVAYLAGHPARDLGDPADHLLVERTAALEDALDVHGPTDGRLFDATDMPVLTTHVRYASTLPVPAALTSALRRATDAAWRDSLLLPDVLVAAADHPALDPARRLAALRELAAAPHLGSHHAARLLGLACRYHPDQLVDLAQRAALAGPSRRHARDLATYAAANDPYEALVDHWRTHAQADDEPASWARAITRTGDPVLAEQGLARHTHGTVAAAIRSAPQLYATPERWRAEVLHRTGVDLRGADAPTDETSALVAAAKHATVNDLTARPLPLRTAAEAVDATAAAFIATSDPAAPDATFATHLALHPGTSEALRGPLAEIVSQRLALWTARTAGPRPGMGQIRTAQHALAQVPRLACGLREGVAAFTGVQVASLGALVDIDEAALGTVVRHHLGKALAARGDLLTRPAYVRALLALELGFAGTVDDLMTAAAVIAA